MSRTWRRHPKHEEWREVGRMDAGESVYHAARCFGKKVYDTRAKATRAKRRQARLLGKRYRVYRCGFCGKWHLTTKHWTY